MIETHRCTNLIGQGHRKRCARAEVHGEDTERFHLLLLDLLALTLDFPSRSLRGIGRAELALLQADKMLVQVQRR